MFDAIISLCDYPYEKKLFAIQIDFEKYFDNIPTSYLTKKIRDKRTVNITPHEQHVFLSLLKHRYADINSYENGPFKRKNKGTPQGSSASLFLANLANHDLDQRLSSNAGNFARFADDVVALCNSYEDAQKLENCFDIHCQQSGLKINRNKSPGIAIVSEFQQEIRTVPAFDFLGYSFSSNGLSLPIKSEKKLKQKISRLINIYLINHLKIGFSKSRANGAEDFDWDLLGLIYEIRRGLYGGLTEKDIQNYLNHKEKLPNMRGLMGFYCLLNQSKNLREIDGWIVSMVRRACVKRNQILTSIYSHSCPTPSNQELILGTWFDKDKWRDAENGDEPELLFPSLVRGWRAARKHYFTFGLEDVQSPGYDYASDISTLFDAFDYWTLSIFGCKEYLEKNIPTFHRRNTDAIPIRKIGLNAWVITPFGCR